MRFLKRPMRAVFAAALLLIGLQPGFGQDESGPPRDLNDILKLKSGKRPKPISQAAPIYPYAMSAAGLMGSVAVEFIINAQGNVENAFVVKSNNPWFERPAVDAIMKWKFTPGEIDGRPIKVRAMQLIEFSLDYGRQADGLWRVTKGKNHQTLPPDYQWETAPVPINTRYPVYPFEPLKAGKTGKVAITYVVGTNGRVSQAKVTSATVPEFGEAVLAMIDAWQFTPPKRKDGTPCSALVGGEYEFKPNGRGDVPVSDETKDLLRALEKKPESILTMNDLDKPLKPLSRRPPVYPSGLKQIGQDGEATIEFLIDKNGDAQLPWVVTSSASEFGYAAAQAVATWRFEVPRKGGKPVFVRTRIPIEFSLREPKPAANK
jgi:TonB family protein